MNNNTAAASGILGSLLCGLGLHARKTTEAGAVYCPRCGKILQPIPMQTIDTIDERSEGNLKGLHLSVQFMARNLVRECAKQGITIKVTSGLRSYEEQNALYEQGRTKPGKRVTDARGGYSNHNFGIAFDVTIFKGKSPVWESPQYKIVGAIGKRLGLEWGGDWKSFQDEPHFQLRPNWAIGMPERTMLAEMRSRKARGIELFA